MCGVRSVRNDRARYRDRYLQRARGRRRRGAHSRLLRDVPAEQCTDAGAAPDAGGPRECRHVLPAVRPRARCARAPSVRGGAGLVRLVRPHVAVLVREHLRRPRHSSELRPEKPEPPERRRSAGDQLEDSAAYRACRSTAPISAAGSIGFERTATAPAFLARLASGWAERTMTGIAARSVSLVSSARTSQPSKAGIVRSRSTRQGHTAPLRMARRASRPPRTSATGKPALSSSAFSPTRTSSLSSTTSTGRPLSSARIAEPSYALSARML